MAGFAYAATDWANSRISSSLSPLMSEAGTPVSLATLATASSCAALALTALSSLSSFSALARAFSSSLLSAYGASS
ncbi:MAG: hypothetical protein E6Y86_08800 [Slackia sp.]|nr:hypothetical protein [Slackia sp.]